MLAYQGELLDLGLELLFLEHKLTALELRTMWRIVLTHYWRRWAAFQAKRYLGPLPSAALKHTPEWRLCFASFLNSVG